jgi:hypothetical protein
VSVPQAIPVGRLHHPTDTASIFATHSPGAATEKSRARLLLIQLFANKNFWTFASIEVRIRVSHSNITRLADLQSFAIWLLGRPPTFTLGFLYSVEKPRSDPKRAPRIRGAVSASAMPPSRVWEQPYREAAPMGIILFIRLLATRDQPRSLLARLSEPAFAVARLSDDRGTNCVFDGRA